MQLQTSLFDAPPMARSTDPATSHAAAASAKQLQGDHHRLILAALAHGPAGKTGIARVSGLDHIAVARRATELARLGMIEWTGRTVQSTAGRQEREWRLRGGTCAAQ